MSQTLRNWLKPSILLAAALASCASSPFSTESARPLPAMWPGRGSTDCKDRANADPAIYPFQYDANTWILRENKCFNFEGNFLYLLFGHDKVLLQDTGSIPRGYTPEQFRQAFPIRDVVEGIISAWLAAHPQPDGTTRPRESLELLVTHSHSHPDHVAGDFQFRDSSGAPYPHTRIVGLGATDVQMFFGISAWPEQSASLDLGGRVLDILPTPGHQAAHVVVYDHGARLLLSGDMLLPGHILAFNWPELRASALRMQHWISETDAQGRTLRPITHVLGNHIEKRPEPGEGSFYPYPSRVQERESKLELTAEHVRQLASEAQALGAASPGREVYFDDFMIDATR
jgi:glyoxylase-like metal-dependent hydrolase (beta-lactamase superfamily II)